MLILIVSIILYALLLALLMLLFRARPEGLSSELPAFSVIVAARNESRRILPLLESLKGLDYPLEKYEIILVDDASQDDTAAIMEQHGLGKGNWQVLKLETKSEALPGKKNALHTAIKKARGQIIAVTDADCTVPAGWLKALAAAFNKNTLMVLGHSRIKKQPGRLNAWLRMDNLFSGIMIALPARLGFPNSSVGRNMAYRKDAYLESGGYPQLSAFASGDDVHLTELFRRRLNGEIRFAAGKDITTETLPPAGKADLFQQQVRKNSKLLQKSAGSVMISLVIFAAHIALYGAPWIFGLSPEIWLSALAAKAGVETIALKFFATKLDEKCSMAGLLIFALLYPLYVIFFGLLGSARRYRWK